jgi:mevalonate kinase
MRGTACGKVILLGEHAVVYGAPALAVGIDRGARATASPTPGQPSTLHVGGWNIKVSDAKEDEPLARAFTDLLAVTRQAAGPDEPSAFSVDAEADLPPGGGLGCSAALGVAVARSLDPSATPETIAARVMAWERVFHGNPSGVDAAVSALGGGLLFQRTDGEPARIERVRIPRALHLAVGHSGAVSSTKTMVEAVARLRERRPEIVQKAFDGITTLVRNARLALEDGDVRGVGQLMDLNQMLLSGLFVSTPEIEHMCAAAREAGAAGAKLTGAGGGGCVAALVHDAAGAEAVVSAWRREGFDGFVTTFGADPVPLVTQLRALVAAGGAP